jgi:hypothetical protein
LPNVLAGSATVQRLTELVFFFVRNHMMPAALPAFRYKDAGNVESPLFSLLLELYRCDESSSSKDLRFLRKLRRLPHLLRHVKNPYRSAEAKKSCSVCSEIAAMDRLERAAAALQQRL